MTRFSLSLPLSHARAATAMPERNWRAGQRCNSIVHRMQTLFSPSLLHSAAFISANKRTVSVCATLHTPSVSKGPTVGSPEPSAHNKPSRWLRLSRYRRFSLARNTVCGKFASGCRKAFLQSRISESRITHGGVTRPSATSAVARLRVSREMSGKRDLSRHPDHRNFDHLANFLVHA